MNEDPNQRMIRELREELEKLRNSVGKGASSEGNNKIDVVRVALSVRCST